MVILSKLTLNIKKEVFLPCYQPYIYDYSSRYNVYWGGRGSGKTKFIMQKLLIKGLKEKRLILLMRKETNKIRDSVWKELIEVINDFKLNSYFSINKTEFRVTCNINGTEFKCLGLDEPEKIKGFTAISDVFMDEVTAFNPDDIELIDGTLRSNIYELPLQMYFAFNPISKVNFVYKYFGFDKGIIPPQTFILHSTYLDNPFLDDSFRDRMDNMKLRNYNRWKIEALGEFCSLDKLVYTDWEKKDLSEVELKDFPMLVGLDFGFVNDMTALIISFIDHKNKSIYIRDEWFATGKTNDEIANVIKSKGLSKSLIIADSAEPKSIEEIKKQGVTRIKESVKGKDSIIHGIQKIQQYKIYVDYSCVETITELENYSWQKDKQTGEYINKPIDSFNHMLDALRYSLQCEKTGKIKSVDKSILGL